MAYYPSRIGFYFERPTQFEAPFFKFLNQRNNLRVLAVFEKSVEDGFDKEQQQKLTWGFNLYEGYPNECLSKDGIFWHAVTRNGILIFNGYSKPHLFLAALVAKCLGSKIFLRTDSVIYPDGANSSCRYRWLKSLIYRFYDGFLVTGAGGFNYLTDFLKIPKSKKIIFFPYSVDLDRYTPKFLDASIPDPILLPMIEFLEADSRIPLLVIAKLNNRESPFDLINTFKRYKDLQKIYKVTVVGSGDCLESLRLECQYSDLESTFHFFGYMPYVLLPAIYSKHKIFYHGPDSEPFGVSVIEAAAAGLFVLTNTKVGSTEELLRWSTSGYFHQVGDYKELHRLLIKLKDQNFDRMDISQQVIKGFAYDVLERRLIEGLS